METRNRLKYFRDIDAELPAEIVRKEDIIKLPVLSHVKSVCTLHIYHISLLLMDINWPNATKKTVKTCARILS